MEKKEKIYIGNGKTIEGQYGTFRSSSICLTDIPKEHIFEYNGKKYIKVIINDKKEVDQYGKNVSIQVDTWKPEKKEDTSNDDVAPEDIPF